MPDIAMCFGGECPRKNTCYRHTATPNEYRQSYGMFEKSTENEKCNYYIKAGVSSNGSN